MRRTVAVWASTAVVLAACGTGGSGTRPSSTTAQSSANSSTVQVVASTNVWGDIAATVGGEGVTVTSIIGNAGADPHSYEASGQNQLAVSKAQLIVENGGGYDDFMADLTAASGTPAPVIDAVTEAGHGADGEGELNEHVWYDLPTVQRVATKIADTLSTLDAADAASYARNAAEFAGRVTELIAQQDQLATTTTGKSVVMTEPVPAYLVAACGLTDATPAEFSRAIEDGHDVPATVLAQTVALLTDHKVAALLYNEQTTGPQTDAVLQAARTAGVPVVAVTETLPAAQDYLSWMSGNIAALGKAVG